MTFDELVSDVMERLNLTSLDARERVGRRVNTRYRRVVSSIGLQTSQRVIGTLSINPVLYPDLPELTLTDMEKVWRIRLNPPAGGIRTLQEVTYDEIDNTPTVSGQPRSWAVKNMGPAEVTIVLDAFPTDTFNLTIEGYDRVIDLEGSQEPFFPEDFHDVLVEGVMSDELRKMEKAGLAKIAEDNFALRLSDLRLFIAKSGYKDTFQGKTKPTQLWYRPWYSRVATFN